MTMTLSMQQVTKGFIGKPLFENLSFTFENGCYCIVGQNGVGKTVLLEMLAGVQTQDSGLIKLSNVGDNSSVKFKEKLVFIPGKPHFFPSTTGTDFLNFVISTKKNMTDAAQVENLISMFNLKIHLNNKFSKMSLGTQKKLFLTTLAIGNNSLIVLDEPENGLDSHSFHVLCDVLEDLKSKAIIILATHDSVLIERLSPIIIELAAAPTSYLKTTSSRYKVNEKIL